MGSSNPPRGGANSLNRRHHRRAWSVDDAHNEKTSAAGPPPRNSSDDRLTYAVFVFVSESFRAAEPTPQGRRPVASLKPDRKNAAVICEIMEAQARRLGADELRPSWRAGKKWVVCYKARWIHFGAVGYDFTTHGDRVRRASYRRRHAGILLVNGQPAYKDKTKPAYWAYRLLW